MRWRGHTEGEGGECVEAAKPEFEYTLTDTGKGAATDTGKGAATTALIKIKNAYAYIVYWCRV